MQKELVQIYNRLKQILKEWNFDPALCEVSVEAENWLRDTNEAAD